MISHVLSGACLTDRNQTAGHILASRTDRRAVESVCEFVLHGYGGELLAFAVP